jgi:hypothetical protein
MIVVAELPPAGAYFPAGKCPKQLNLNTRSYTNGIGNNISGSKISEWKHDHNKQSDKRGREVNPYSTSAGGAGLLISVDTLNVLSCLSSNKKIGGAI